MIFLNQFLKPKFQTELYLPIKVCFLSHREHVEVALNDLSVMCVQEKEFAFFNEDHTERVHNALHEHSGELASNLSVEVVRDYWAFSC